MSSGVDDVIFGNVDRSGENIGRHIGNHRNVYIQVFFKFSTINSVIGRDVEIISISRHCIILRNISISRLCGRSDFNYFTESFGFFHGFLSPYTCIQVSSFLFEEVEGDHAEFQTGTTAQEQYRIPFRDIE